MKHCQKCREYNEGYCQNYNKMPPEDFAKRCRFYDEVEGRIIEEKKDPCETCKSFDDGWCWKKGTGSFAHEIIRIDRRGFICHKGLK